MTAVVLYDDTSPEVVSAKDRRRLQRALTLAIDAQRKADAGFMLTAVAIVALAWRALADCDETRGAWRAAAEQVANYHATILATAK